MTVNSELVRIFVANLRRVRKSKNITQEDMAYRLGISQPSYQSIESGKSAPNLATVDRVCNALQTSVHTLLSADSFIETAK